MAVAASAYDANFACCGGCSSSKRADAYNDRLQNGAHIFIWDTKLKNNPSASCLATFPYDKALNEQEGDRRVRSGRLVGTSYPIDHDFDPLCCEQRGSCQALEEDATGKCQCVKKWGFTGDHCEYSVYDVARQNNSALFPAATNLSKVTALLPDLRGYLVDFDMEAALAASRDSPASTGSLLSVFQFSSDITYGQFAWTHCAYVVLGAAFFLVLFLIQLIWSFCCFKCGCRKKDLRKQPKVYSTATKICWGVFMLVFLVIGTAASVVSLLTVHSKLVPARDAIQSLLGSTLPSAIAEFETAFLQPLDLVLHASDTSVQISLAELQNEALASMTPLTFLDAQSTTEDLLRKPVFDQLDQLKNYSILYPTVNSPSIDCTKMNITPNVVTRMAIGATTGCFRCKTCSLLTNMLADADDRWRRNAYRVQLDLRESREQLLEFGSTENELITSILAFRDRINSSSSAFSSRVVQIADQFDQLSTEAQQLATFGLFVLIGLSGLSVVLAITAFGVGIASNKRPLARSTCFVGEIACIVALLLVGVLYSVAAMAHDGIAALDLFNANVSLLIAPQVAVEDVTHMLFDHSIVERTGMNETLAFADTLRVPPHPTPADDDPPRFDIGGMYDLPDLFTLATQARDFQTARNSLFGWEQSYLDAQYGWLYVWAFGNDSVVSPYNETLHQTLLYTSVAELMDPDNDTKLVTDDDLLYIQSVFNESWRGVDDRGAWQNDLIAAQWLLVARLELQKRRLDQYLTDIAGVISGTKPTLQSLITFTAELEAAEFALKARVEFFTTTLRAAELRDCSYDGNCVWLRSTVNELFAAFQDLVTHAEFAAICCAGSVVGLLLGLACAGCFAHRLRRNIVKVYSAT